MQMRPGRGQSLIGGILALVILFAGLAMMRRFGAGFRLPNTSLLVWIVFGLIGAGIAFYNAFGKRGLPSYEIEDEDGGFCTNCGQPVGAEDNFCRRCGEALR